MARFLADPEPYMEKRCLADQDRAQLESNFFWFLPTDFAAVTGGTTVAAFRPDMAHYSQHGGHRESAGSMRLRQDVGSP